MGNELFKKVTEATGLPEDLIAKELSDVLSTHGITTGDVDMEQLRSAMAQYLRQVILGAKDSDEGFSFEEEISPEDLGKE